MLVICHAHNTFDKRILLAQKNPLLKKTTLKLKNLVRDKKLRDFYLDLAKDYVGMPPAPDAVARAQEMLDVSAVMGSGSLPVPVPDVVSVSGSTA